jgi:GNAT superfamily N-acetyltransferase
MQIRQAATPDEIAVVRVLFEEYAAALGIDLCFQGFADELANLPGVYAPPRGRLLLAWSGDHPSGCAALRPLDETVCELKRMYVRPAFRGQGAGRALGEAIISAAREIGYCKIRLDTLEKMNAARRLYESLGFTHRNAYYETPLLHTVFLELQIISEERPD